MPSPKWDDILQVVRRWSFSLGFSDLPLLIITASCGLVVRAPACRFRGPGSIPGTTRFLRSSGSGTGFTQPRECNWGVLGIKISGSGLEIREYGRGIQHADRVTPLYQQKLALTSDGIVRSQTKASKLLLIIPLLLHTRLSLPPRRQHVWSVTWLVGWLVGYSLWKEPEVTHQG
jgi:hypothetical protein